MVEANRGAEVPRHLRGSKVPSRLRAALAAAMLMTLSGVAAAQQQQFATEEFSVERRDALRRIWQTDPAIRDHVEPGDTTRLSTNSTYYSADYTAGLSVAPVPALPGPLVAVVVAVAAD